MKSIFAASIASVAVCSEMSGNSVLDTEIDLSNFDNVISYDEDQYNLQMPKKTIS